MYIIVMMSNEACADITVNALLYRTSYMLLKIEHKRALDTHALYTLQQDPKSDRRADRGVLLESTKAFVDVVTRKISTNTNCDSKVTPWKNFL